MTVEARRRRAPSAASKKTRDGSAHYGPTSDEAAKERLRKRLDKTIDGVVRDYGEALRRLEDF